MNWLRICHESHEYTSKHAKYAIKYADFKHMYTFVYDYMHLRNLPDISAYRTVVKSQI